MVGPFPRLQAGRRWLERLAAALALLASAGCTGLSLPRMRDRPPSVAQAAEGTRLHGLFAPEAALHPGLSGFAPLESGPDAFVARRALAGLAERTLDVQYYVWANDASGRLLARALLDAANRGVRVRMLLDDAHTSGLDTDLGLLDAHPNIEVRLFNPFLSRSLRVGDALLDFARVNHRMHNKVFIADNAAAIVGGRNVADHYFTADSRTNYRDLDMLAAGPVVPELSRSFDDYWNSRWSVSIRRFLKGKRIDRARLRVLTERIEGTARSPEALPFEREVGAGVPDDLARRLPHGLTWGEATVVADRPDKPKTDRPYLLERLRALLGGDAERELLIESAYFIPGDEGVQRLCSLAAEGVRVRILTNSLASTDVALAHVGYARSREPLVRCGVELHELRADPRFAKRWRWLAGRSLANLHTKAIVIDRRQTVIGSLNLDPRSATINTEIAVLIDSRDLAEATAAFIEEGMEPGNAYQLELDDGGRLTWLADDGGRTVRLGSEPGAGFWRRVGLRLLSFLPIDGQL